MSTIASVSLLPILAVVVGAAPARGDGPTDDATNPRGLRADPSRRYALWRSDLPWNDLASKLQDPSSLIDTSPANYLEECLPEFDNAFFGRSNWALIDQPSGLCMGHLFCAFEDCDPKPGNNKVSNRVDALFPIYLASYSDVAAPTQSWVENVNNPKYALPGRVLHPRVASDVVAAVEFAKEHGLEISVKNSGHHYAGASTKADTLLLNMRRYEAYSSSEGGILDCAAEGDYGDDGLEGQPCRLALARGKPGVVRVGGGENWSDVYLSVRENNLENDPENFKYHAGGAAAGTVSPHGWAYQGGLLGTTAGRLFGFGVDQIVLLEMVLPSGAHVKFGPTEWEDVEGYAVPKTVSVSGVCRTNPRETDERQWVWDECPDDSIPFQDLWMAVRGGGGGTWGVVLSAYHQLHDYPGRLYQASIPSDDTFCDSGLTEDQIQVLRRELGQFAMHFLLDPQAMEVDEDESFACGNPDGFNDDRQRLFCYGEQSVEAYFSAWKRYLEGISQSLEDEAGIAPDQIASAASCTISTGGISGEGFDDWASYFLLPEGGRFAGNVRDSPPPFLPSTTSIDANILVPREWILSNISKAIGLLRPGYLAFGGYNMQATSDQANSISDAHRNGGYMFLQSLARQFDPQLSESLSVLDDTFYSEIFPEMYDTSDKNNFPGFIGSNHAGPYTRGPLKEDWTRACPLSWPEKRRDEECISLQEAIYGTQLLKRLESIKETVDPSNIFNCRHCIGYDKNKEKKGGMKQYVKV